MDPELIEPDLVFAKTPAGEEAILQRTRVVQRNVRLVLILVDGNATVAELCEKTAKASQTHSALVELEQGGFIERRVEKNSVWKPNRDSPKRNLASATPMVSEFSTFGERTAAPPASSSSPSSHGRDVLPFHESREGQSSSSPGSLASRPTPGAPDSSAASASPEAAAAEPEPPLAAAAATAAGFVDRLKSRVQRATDDKPDIKPIRRRGRRWSLTWTAGLLLGSLLLGAGLFLVALFFPYTHYLPAVEAMLAQSTGQAARVDDMRVRFYPKPGLLLGDVRLGEGVDKDPIHITEIRLRPALATLLSPKMLFSEVELSGVRLSAEAITSLSRMLATASREPASAGVLQVTVSKAEVYFAGLAVSEMSGDFELSTDKLLHAVALHSRDHSLQITLKPTDRGATLHVEGLAWRPAPASPYLFDSVNLKGEIDGQDLAVSSLELRIFDGLVRGSAILRAPQARSMAGEISFERINARKLGDALGVANQIEGETRGRLKFSATSETWAGVFSDLRASGDFTMHRGRLTGIDLAEAMRRVSTTPLTLGGWTRFEELSGTVTLTPGTSSFSRLVMDAGLMQSSGQIEVGRDLQVRGAMNVVLGGSADRTARRILISGSLKNPLTQTASR